MEDLSTSSFSWVVCPLCHTSLNESETALTCHSCTGTYPVCLGIPDFRSAHDYRGAWAKEAQILPKLVEIFSSANVHDLLEEMIAGFPDKRDRDRDQMRDYFVDGLAGRAKSRVGVIEMLAARYGSGLDYSHSLEVGCGAGATLFELSRRGAAVGIDPNLLHLVIAKKHAEELGLQVKLACGFAETLPFPSSAFSLVHFMHTLEHFTDQDKGLADVRRTLAPNGLACFDIPNRFSLWREPHTRIWGIGFLPRRWTELRRIQNQSLWRLNHLVRNAFGEHFRIDTMLVRFQVPGYERGIVIRAIARVLRVAESTPGLRTIVRFFQPGFEVVASRPGSD